MGFRGRQIAALTVTALTVAVATGVISAAIVVRVQVLEARDRADLLARTLYHLASRILREPGHEDLRSEIAADRALRQYAEAVVGYSPIILYVAIEDRDDTAILHSDRRQEGRKLARAETFAEFSKRNAFSQLLAVSRDHRVLVADLPFSADGVEQFGSVVVAVSTLLLKRQLLGVMTTHALFAGVVVVLAFLTSFLVANRALAPMERLRAELARIDPGQGQPPLDLRTEADVSRLVDFFATVSERLAGEGHPGPDRAGPKTLLDGLADAVVVFGRDRRVLALNDDACRLLGRSRGDLVARPIDDLLARGHPFRTMADEALGRDQAIRSRTVTLSVNGREASYLLTSHLLREARRPSGVMIAARDLERLSRLGSELSHSRKLAALGRLTSGVAHEIKNPLNALVLQVELLRQKLGEAHPDARRHLDVVEEEVRRLDRVIQGFLKFTRPEEIQLESVRLDALIREALDLMAARADRGGVRIEAHVPPELPVLRGSTELLRQLLLNLMGNAFDAMPRGGVLRVRAESPTGGPVTLSVEDTGDGIAPEDLPRVFDLFYTTKSDGSGIGLAIAHHIVELHGGEIRVDSEPGSGTRVTMTLPESS